MNRRELVATTFLSPLVSHALQAQTSTPATDKSKRRVIAGSGAGIVPSEEPVQLFAEWVGEGAKVLHLPIARWDDDPLMPLMHDFLWSALEPAGIDELDIWLRADIEADDFEPNLDDYSGIYIGDGYLPPLLRYLHASGLFEALIAACDRGCVLFGTGIGTTLFGVNAMAAEGAHVLDDDLSPEEVNGLDVIQAEDGSGLVAVPHWRGRTRTWEEAARITGLRFARIPDGSAWTLNEGVYAEVGPNPIHWI